MSQIYKTIFIAVLTVFVACNSQVTEDQLTDQIGINPKVIELNWDLLTVVPAKGRVIDPDSVKTPGVVKAGKPETYRAYSNVSISVFPKVDTIKEVLTKIFPGKDSDILLTINPANGKKVKFNYPVPVSAMPATFKDNAKYNIRKLGIDQGMSTSYVRAILEDSRGNLWIGTYDKGVSMYDGESFTHFTEKDGLSSNTINTIIEDSKGNIWFGTWGGGACMYNGEYFMHYTEKEGLAENHIYSIFEDKDGNLWFGTEGQGVCVYDGKNFRHFIEKDYPSNNIIRAITQDIDGNIWLGTYAGGVLKYSISESGEEFFLRYTEKDGLCNDNIRALYADKKGRLWIGTNEGLDVLYENTITHYTTDEGLPYDIITKIIETQNGDMLISTRGKGASIFNGENFTHITKNEGLSDNIITSVIEDVNGIIWFGTRSGGLNIYNPYSFRHLTEKEGASGYPIISVLADKKNNIWFGTSGNGINKYDKNTVSTYTNKEGLSHNYIYSILEDKNGDIWVGTAGGGVNRFANKEPVDEFIHYGKEEGLSNRLILGILEDKKGNIWFSTKGEGVYCYNGTNFTNYNKTNGLNNNTIFAMLETHNGDIWFGTYGGGINIFTGENFSWFTPKEGLCDSTIFSLYEDTENNIWIGTEKNGVLKFNGQSIIQITEEDGLNSNLVGAIIGDSLKRIWLGTNNGVNVIENDSDNIINIYGFNKKDGLKNLDFSNPSLCRDKQNEILWANGKDITIINPAKFKLESSLLKVNITNININQEHINFSRLNDTSYCKQFSFGEDLKSTFSKIDPFTNYPTHLELPYYINHLTFHFSANNRLAPHKIKYSYFMQGLDKEWSIPNKESKADYRNIPSGEYIFKVRVIGESQKWSKIFEYPLTIKSPWWLSWWAFLIYVSSLAAFIYLIVRFRTVQLKKRQKELSLMVAERTSEVETQKDKILSQNKELIKLDEFKRNLTSMIVHDLKNPLNNILALTDEQENDKRIEKKQNFDLIKSLGNQMLNLVLNILDVNKFEDTKVELNLDDNNIKSMADRAIVQTHFLAYQKHIVIKNFISGDYIANCDREIVERTFVNLLTNAIKYTAQNKEININCEEINKTELPFDPNQFKELLLLKNDLLISVNDQGIGVNKDKAEHIFDKFVQLSGKRSGSMRSTGLGLSFCKLAVEAHGGKIGLISKPKKGSSFWFTFKKVEQVHKIPVKDIPATENSFGDFLLTHKDIELLSPLLEKLQDIQFYEVTTIKKLLQDYDFSDNIVLQTWKKELLNTVVSCNKQKYELAINP